jgi:hypothetical protein
VLIAKLCQKENQSQKILNANLFGGFNHSFSFLTQKKKKQRKKVVQLHKQEFCEKFALK